MGRKRREPGSGGSWEAERSLAAAEEEWTQLVSPSKPDGAATSDTVCPCGSRDFLLAAYLHVVDGVPRPTPVEVEALTCPECGREFEAIEGEGGRVLRGDFLGWSDDEGEEEP